jgi:hypothetical protein
MDLKDHRKKNREKRKVFKLHTLLIMSSLCISIILLISDINFGFDMTFFLLGIYLFLSFIFDKNLRISIINLFKNSS